MRESPDGCVLRNSGGPPLLACDISEEWTAYGREAWEKAGVTDRIDLPDDVCLVDDIPHDWLFPRMAAVARSAHGGGAPAHVDQAKSEAKPAMMRPKKPASSTASAAISGIVCGGVSPVVTTRLAICWPCLIGALTGPS